MKPSCIVVVGASAGGVTSLTDFVGGLPADFSGAVFVVLHIGPDAVSRLPEVLTKSGPLVAGHPSDDEEIEGGRIYVAPPDHHLLVDGKRVTLARGPKENRFRPSIDALFRSAAYTYGSRAIGVVLSGALDDGTSGLWAIKRLGGTTIVQDPADAQFDSMPMSALNQVKVDYFSRAADMGPLLGRLAHGPFPDAPRDVDRDYEQIGVEVKIAASANAFQQGILKVGELTPFTCPECHGVLVKLKEGTANKFRCHTGHAYSTSALLAGITEQVGIHLWQTTRALEECVMLLDDAGQGQAAGGDERSAKAFFKQARGTETVAKALQKVTLRHKLLSENQD